MSSLNPWSLHNPVKGWTLHQLSAREARLIVQTLTPVEKSATLAWKAGDPIWMHLHHPAAMELVKPEPATIVKTPAIPVQQQTEEEITHVRMEKSNRQWQREFQRITAEIPAEVLLGSQRFRATTENLSEGGIKFKELLPSWVAGYFTVILTRPEGSLEVTCMLVEDQKGDKTRVAVVDTNDEESHLPIYRAWIRGNADDVTMP